jgi:signal transduction histidine kinase/ligand-binding sensor domain-containing protein/DNA-binding response OmpR family regulator
LGIIGIPVCLIDFQAATVLIMVLGKQRGGFLIGSLLFIFSSLLPAQPNPAEGSMAVISPSAPYQVKQYTLLDGLPDNFVNALLQDRYGFIWIGTSDGLSRFDGIRFETFRHQTGDPSSISNNKINALMEDRQGYIWAATDGGLNRYDPATETFRHFMYDPDDEHSISHDITRAVFEDEAGVIWVGAFNGLNRLDPTSFRFTAYLHQDPFSPFPPLYTQSIQEVSVIGETADGQLLVGYWGIGVMLFDKKTGHFQPVPVNGSLDARHNIVVERITRTAEGGIWVCATGRLFRYDAIHGLTHFPEINMESIAIFTPTPSGVYFAGGKGFMVLDKAFREVQRFVPDTSPVDPNQNLVLAAIEDRAGDIWFGSMGGGLFHLAAEHKSFVNYRHQKGEENGLHDNFINALAEVGEDLVWVGSRRQGISVFDHKSNTFSPLPNYMDYPKGMKTREISVIYPDRDRNIWIGTWGAGLHLYRPSEKAFQYFLQNQSKTTSLSDNYVTDILQTAEGEIWVGTTLGLSVLFSGENVKKGLFKHYRFNPGDPGGLNHFRVTCIRQTRSGQIWVGTHDGLHRYDREKEVFALYRQEPDKPGALCNNTIKCIFEDSKERLWIGTAGGLNMYDAERDAFLYFPGTDELLDGSIIGIQEDEKGFLWVATKRGIGRFDPEGMTCKLYDNRDGLDNHSFNPRAFLRSPSSGMIYAGGRNGMSVFEPVKIRENPFTPPVWITGLRKYASRKGKPAETIVKGMAGRTKIELAHWENIIAFELTSLNLKNSEKNQFAYRLAGFNDNWIDIGTRREITFTNLNVGAYTLQVKSANNDGVWNDIPVELTIIVHPPWWKTWWAYMLYVLLLFCIIYSLRRYELNRQRLAFQLKAEKSEAVRLKELDTFKARLYTNLTHEFRTPLTVIIGMADQLINRTDAIHRVSNIDAMNRVSAVALLIKRNGQNLLRLINQLLDLSKLETNSLQLHLRQGDIVPYLRYVTESFQTFANGKNLSLRFFSPAESLVMDFDPEQIKQVLVNLISNALKFTPSGGEVMVRLLPQDDQLGIEVQDTGIGIPATDLPNIFDRFYQVDGSNTREGEGTGIGLAHTKELVKLLGGQISVQSNPGQGSSFFVRLPIHREAEKNTELIKQEKISQWAPELTEEAVTIPQETSGLPQLLLIEDNPDLVVYLKSCLNCLYQVDVAYNGQIGIEKALEQVPDLIISDVMMPGKDGFEVCDTLKNDRRTSHIPIILLTAKADNASRIAGLRRGADAYLAKPFDREELLVRLEMLLERQKRMAAWFSQQKHVPPFDARLEEAIQVEDAFIRMVRGIIETNYADENFALPMLCEEIGMSRSQLFRKMTALVNTSPSDYIRSYRLQKARELLETTELTVSEVAWQVGYKDLSHFSRNYREAFGMPPSARSPKE